jgi:hypothetical protein
MTEGKCSRCNKSAVLDGISYCKDCLCSVVERRVRKQLPKSDNRKVLNILVVCKDKNSLQCVSAVYLLGRLSNGKVKVIKNRSASKKGDLVVVPNCSDVAAEEFISSIIKDTAIKTSLDGTANVFQSITESELLSYARIKKLKYRETKKTSLVKNRIQEMQKKYPGTIGVLVKSGNLIKELTRK